MTHSPLRTVLAFAVMAACICALHAGDSSEIHPSGARLTKPRVIQIARRTAAERGERLQDYQEPIIHFHVERSEWTLWYHRKPPTPIGGHFGVFIDDTTGEARFVAGR